MQKFESENAGVQRKTSDSVCNCKVHRGGSSLHIRRYNRSFHLPLLTRAFPTMIYGRVRNGELRYKIGKFIVVSVHKILIRLRLIS